MAPIGIFKEDMQLDWILIWLFSRYKIIDMIILISVFC